MAEVIGGLDELLDNLENMNDRVGKVQNVVVPVVENSEVDPKAWERIRKDLGLPQKLRTQMPLIENMSKKELEALIKEKGLESVIEDEFLLEDLQKYVTGK